MLEAVRALCAEREVPAQLALESGMACGYGACFGCVVPTRDGYVRLCVDGPVLDAERLDAVGEHAGASAPRAMTELCGLALAHPIVNASGTFDAIAARRASGTPAGALPVRGLRVQDGHARAARGQPAAAAVGAAGGMINSIGLPNKGLRRLPRPRTCRARRAAGAADRQRHGLQARGGRRARGGGRRAPRGGGARAQRLVPERQDRPASWAPTRARPRRCSTRCVR